MLGNDSLPRRPRSARNLGDYRDARASGESERGALKRASNDSLLSSSVNSRPDEVDFKDSTEPYSSGRARPSRRSPRSDPRRKSKSPSNASPSRSASPKSSKYRKSPSSQKSPRYLSPKSKSPGHRKSPRIKGGGYLSSDAKKQLDGSFPALESMPKGADRTFAQSDDDADSLPALVDDSIVRERVEGYRGGKQWNILEDTPGGHAPEKLVIIPGVECYADEDDEVLDEDEDIEDDPLMIDDPMMIPPHSISNRNNRKQSLPDDPSAKRGTFTPKRRATAGRDRFDPSFNNNDMWATDDDDEVKLSLSHSGDVSILSEHIVDVDTVSELGAGSALTITTDEASRQRVRRDEARQADDGSNPSSADISKTPATTKRSGGRPYNVGNMERFPNLGESFRANMSEEEDLHDGASDHPASVPEDAPLSTTKKKSRRKKRSSPPAPLSPRQSLSSHKPPSSYERARGNNSGRSSSNRRSAHTHSGSRSRTAAGMERNAVRGSRGVRKVPDVVPATPMREATAWMRCSPMSSSLTSTPTSLASSMQHQQQASLQQLRARRRKNKPLHAHVGRETSPPPDDTDEHTLGASTITTNFSTTQRTCGDNTVSTRSLFRSEQMSNSERLTIPQRRREESDYEHSEEDQSSTIVDEVEELHGSAEIESQALSSYEILEGAKPAPEGTFKTMLRRPSGQGDDLLDAFALNSIDDGSDNNSNSSEFLRWQKENEKLMSPRADLKKTIEPGTNAFLELNIDDNGVQVDSKVAEVPGIIAPLQISSGEGDNSQRKQMNGHVLRSPDSPLDKFGKKKKPKGARLGLFKRVQSWKGAIALSDDED